MSANHRQRAARKRAEAESHRAVAPIVSLRIHRNSLLERAEILDRQADKLDREAEEIEAGRPVRGD
jgi:hypothetical protein